MTRRHAAPRGADFIRARRSRADLLRADPFRTGPFRADLLRTDLLRTGPFHARLRSTPHRLCRGRIDRRGTSERGVGSVLALSVTAVLLAAVILIAPLAAVLTAQSRARAAADASALAAADVAVGLRSGSPCPAAREAAVAGGATLSACVVDGVVVTVRVAVPAARWDVVAVATAGPPR
ncbi:MAG: hypothetical protein RI885_1024 [Actinomycetota bacterium]